MCAQRLRALGYQVSVPKYANNKSSKNVIGTLQGKKTPAKVVILSAHYDSTDNTCPGADDNATGVAAVLESARVLARQKHDRTLVIACWDEEESNIMGSRAYAKATIRDKQQIILMYAYEMIGYATTKPGSQQVPHGLEMVFPKQIARLKERGSPGDFIALVYDDNPDPRAAAAAFERAASTIGLPTMSLPVPDKLKNHSSMNQLRRSDHASFWEQQMPGIMLTDTAHFRNTHYHCKHGRSDTIDRLDSEFATKVIKATVASVQVMLRD